MIVGNSRENEIDILNSIRTGKHRSSDLLEGATKSQATRAKRSSEVASEKVKCHSLLGKTREK